MTTVWNDNAARFATTREDHAATIEATIVNGLAKAQTYYALRGRRGWARGGWEIVLMCRLLAQLTGDRESAEALADLHYVAPIGDPPSVYEVIDARAARGAGR